MAKNLLINGVTYNAVDSLSIPISGGGGDAVFPDTSDATAVAADIASGETAYVNGVKVTGTATPGGTDTSSGTATADQILDGEIAWVDGEEVEGTMPNNAGDVNAVSYHQTGTSLHIVPAEGYTDGTDDAVVITDADYVATNIKKDVSVFGLTGTYEGSGGGGVVEKDVNFYDYDGTLVYSYTIAEANALSALPALPDHSGDDIPLTGQEWNYTLAQVNALTQKCNVGATYITTDGKTHLIIKITTLGRMDVPIYFTQTVSYGVTIDWGDGTSSETIIGTGNKSKVHTYSAVGIYDITLTVAVGCVLGLGQSTNSYYIIGYSSGVGKSYSNMLKLARIGVRTILNGYAFSSCYSLTYITLPTSVTVSSSDVFASCYSLKFLIIPNGITSIGSGFCSYCASLLSISIPMSITSFPDYMLCYCHSLISIVIPSSVTSIGKNFLQNCWCIASIYIPSSVASIGSYFAANCTALVSIVIPEGITSINTYFVYYSYSLISIVIPSSVTNIASPAFSYNAAVKDIYVYPASPPTLGGTSCFDNIASDAIIHVPTASEAAYKAATNWVEYAAKIVGDL